MKNKHEPSNFELQQEIKQLKHEIKNMNKDKPWSRRDRITMFVILALFAVTAFLPYFNKNRDLSELNARLSGVIPLASVIAGYYLGSRD